jgi:hypothetical protein
MLNVGAWITFALLWWDVGGIRFGSLTVLDWTCVIIVAGCMQTIAVRLRRMFSALAAKGDGG